MAKVYELNGLIPVVGKGSYVHPEAVLIGDVIIGAGCYIGPHASLRGDFGRIEVHDGANVQDGCIFHSFPGTDLIVRRDGHIGHGAVLHGCEIGEDSLVGMNSVVMDGAVLGAECIVGALAFVKAKMQIPDRSMVVGAPARILRPVTDIELGWKRTGTRGYQELAVNCLENMRQVEPLTEVGANRRHLEDPEMKPLYKVERS